MLKLKFQDFGHLMQRADSLEKTNSMAIELSKNVREFEQTSGDGEGQGSLACCNPWGRKESDTTERLNNNRLKRHSHLNYWMVSERVSPSFLTRLSQCIFSAVAQPVSAGIPQDPLLALRNKTKQLQDLRSRDLSWDWRQTRGSTITQFG